jgi:hypothetical protein
VEQDSKIMGAMSRLKVTSVLEAADFVVADFVVANLVVEGAGEFAKSIPIAPVAMVSAIDHVKVCGKEFSPGLRCSIPLP